MSTSNSIQSAINLCIGKKARRIVTDYLSTSPETPAVSKDNFFKILGMDGLFVLQQMTLNLGDIPTSYLTIAMRNISQQWEEDDTDDEERPLKSFKGI